MARKIITGDVELEKKLKGLSDRAADKIARSALSGAMWYTAKVMRRAAPVGATGDLQKSIGSRFEKGNKKNKPVAKVGINVGKQTKKRQQKTQAEIGRIIRAPHGHLVALGTKRRTRKTIGGRFAFLNPAKPEQLTTGVMPAEPFVKQAYEAARAGVTAAMTKRATKALAREVAKQN